MMLYSIRIHSSCKKQPISLISKWDGIRWLVCLLKFNTNLSGKSLRYSIFYQLGLRILKYFWKNFKNGLFSECEINVNDPIIFYMTVASGVSSDISNRPEYSDRSLGFEKIIGWKRDSDSQQYEPWGMRGWIEDFL